MHLRDQRLKFQLHCGATVNILPVDIYQKVFNYPQLARLKKTTTKPKILNKTELTPLGSVKVETLNPKNEKNPKDGIRSSSNRSHAKSRCASHSRIQTHDNKPVLKTSILLKEPLKLELDRLTDKGILQPVHAPTDWVSSMVLATKRNGKIRLCTDPKPLNNALKRGCYPLPVIDDLLPKLTNAWIFKVVDAKKGFWYV